MALSPPYVRDPLTWLSYWMLGYGAYAMGLLGPLMPFLRAERELSFTLGGLLPAAVALGTIVSGLSSDRLAERWGRRRVLWAAAAGVSAGTAGVALSRPFGLLAAAALLMGFCCSLTITMVQATLSDRHRERRGVAITEANVVAALVTSLGPFAIGGLQAIGLGWQGALFLPFVGLAVLAAVYRTVPLPEASAAGAEARPRGRAAALPPGFWAFWVVVVLVVSIEWCLMVWGADYLATVVGFSKVNAATAMGVFFGAMLVGRMAGSRLARVLPGTVLLLTALAVTAAGFPLFWLARQPALNLAGLLIAGLGVASLFPFALTVALGSAPAQANMASARASLGVGVAILGAPLVLGWAADSMGLTRAYGMVGVLIAGATLVTVLAQRVGSQPAPAAPG